MMSHGTQTRLVAAGTIIVWTVATLLFAAEMAPLTEADAALRVAEAELVLNDARAETEPAKVQRLGREAAVLLQPVLERGSQAGEKAWLAAALAAIATQDPELAARASAAIRQLVPEFHKEAKYVTLMARLKRLERAVPFINSLGMRFVSVPGTDVMFSIWETRVQDYRAFATATNREWERPSLEQGPTHPAMNVSWEDAKAFCDWLTKKEQREAKIKASAYYRLPTDAEWSVAVGLPRESGSTPAEKNMRITEVYPWGTQWPPPHGAGNFDGAVDNPTGSYTIADYGDGYRYTSPVGTFAANSFDLHDLSGNVWEFCEDWYDHERKYRVLRGGSWYISARDLLLSSYRNVSSPGLRRDGLGFRCVLVGEAARKAD